MNNMEKIIREELSYILEKDCTDIEKDCNLMDKFKMDSLTILEIISMIEEKFDIELPPEKISELKTIDGIINVINFVKRNSR